MTPGNERSERDVMTATRKNGMLIRRAAPPPARFPARGRRKNPSPALARRFGLAGVAVASGLVGWVLFGDTDPASGPAGPGRCRNSCRRRSPSRSAARRGTRVSQSALAGLDPVDLRTVGRACPAVCRALVGHKILKYGGFAEPLWIANGIATDLLLGLSLTVLPQLYPDGPLPGRLWKILLGVSAGLFVIATRTSERQFITISNPRRVRTSGRPWSVSVG